jgi:hypothetical protein
MILTIPCQSLKYLAIFPNCFLNSGIYSLLSSFCHLLAEDVFYSLVCYGVSLAYLYGGNLPFLDPIVYCNAADSEKLSQFGYSDVFLFGHSSHGR